MIRQSQSHGSVFLSASVPHPDRDEKYFRTADIVAVQAAVSALASVILGHRKLVWGGHPSITPMVLLAARAKGVSYEEWVTLYQSAFYEPEFPVENAQFRNVVITPSVEGDAIASQDKMRNAMFTENNFESAIFIGGMEGVEKEYDMFRAAYPEAKSILVASTGGAAKLLYDKVGGSPRLRQELTYFSLFRDLLEIESDPLEGS